MVKLRALKPVGRAVVDAMLVHSVLLPRHASQRLYRIGLRGLVFYTLHIGTFAAFARHLVHALRWCGINFFGTHTWRI